MRKKFSYGGRRDLGAVPLKILTKTKPREVETFSKAKVLGRVLLKGMEEIGGPRVTVMATAIAFREIPRFQILPPPPPLHRLIQVQI